MYCLLDNFDHNTTTSIEKNYNICEFQIVELSLLDTHESPLEKLNCLCTSFDMVYAEIKLHLISNISKYSGTN